MERYKEISLADLFDHISKRDFKDIYFQRDGALCKANDYNYSFDSLNKKKWFKREVIE